MDEINNSDLSAATQQVGNEVEHFGARVDFCVSRILSEITRVHLWWVTLIQISRTDSCTSPH